MKKINKHIEIVCSTTTWLSSMSKPSRDAVLAALSKHYTNVGITIVNNLSDLELLVAKRPDLVFLGMKFVPVDYELGLEDPNKIWIAKYLDDHAIAYTGSDHVSHELELNKHLAKQCVINAGVKTAPYRVALHNKLQTLREISLDYPLFVKPTNRGGGLGIDDGSVVHNYKELQAKVRSVATELQSDSLIEEYLPGREFSVAILKDEYSQEYSLMPLEIVAPLNKHGERLLSEEVKSSDTESTIRVSNESIKEKITALAMDAFFALGARDYGRIDIRLDAKGVPHFLEANLLPSLIRGYGNFPKACFMNRGLDYEPMLLGIVRLAFAHNEHIPVSPTLDVKAAPFRDVVVLPV